LEIFTLTPLKIYSPIHRFELGVIPYDLPKKLKKRFFTPRTLLRQFNALIISKLAKPVKRLSALFFAVA